MKRYKIDAFDGLAKSEHGYLCYYEDCQALEAERDRYKEALEKIAEIGYPAATGTIAKQALGYD